MDLLQRIEAICRRSRGRFCCAWLMLNLLCVAIFLGVLLLIFGVVDDDGADEEGEPKAWTLLDSFAIVLVPIVVALGVCCAIWNWIANCMLYQSMDEQLSDLVEQIQKEYEDTYGVLIGYRPYRSRNPSLWSLFVTKDGAPCVWLKGLHHQANEEDETMTKINEIAPMYPPMFVYHQIPGEVCVGEKEYHPSTGYDEKTWRSIMETHKKHMAYPCPIKTMSSLIFFGMFTYMAFVNQFVIDRLGSVLGILISYAVIFTPVVYSELLDRFWVLPSLKKVAQEVTRTMQQEDLQEDSTATYSLKGHFLKFEDSPTLSRSGRLSRRYELAKP